MAPDGVRSLHRHAPGPAGRCAAPRRALGERPPGRARGVPRRPARGRPLAGPGPLPVAADRRFRGLCIFRVDAEQARQLSERDPAVRAGLFAVEVLPWMVPSGAVAFSPTRFRSRPPRPGNPSMTSAPPTIDNARVLRVVELSGLIATGKTRHIVVGKVVNKFAALAIVRYEHDEGVYLFYCDEEWNAVTDTYHDDIDAAVAQAEFEFGPLEFFPVSN